jgi:hypothetical protein
MLASEGLSPSVLTEGAKRRADWLFAILMPGLGGAWRSLVAHLLWEQGVGGSNPLAPTAMLARPMREPCGCSSTVEPQPSKLVMGVRFPSPALPERRSV